MLGSTPVPLQAIIWPLAGAAIILTLGRILPNWLRRAIAFAASVASLAVLWSLREGAVQRVEIAWTPLNLFRMSPAFFHDGLGLFAGTILVWFTAAAVFGMRGHEARRTPWHGLLLVTVAGCLIASMAANLLTLAMGSALIDLALIAIAVTAEDDASRADRSAWRMVVPGVVSTFLLFAGAVRMDTQLGHASILARSVSEEVLVLVGVAGLLRLMVYPLFPRGLGVPESAATLILPAGVGVYILARVQSLSPVLVDRSWVVVIAGVALLAGGLLTWAGSKGSKTQLGASEGGFVRVWSGAAVYQTGYAVASSALLATAVPWPMLTFTLALGTLVIWWEGGFGEDIEKRPDRLGGIEQRLGNQWARVRSHLETRTSLLEQWRHSWLGHHWRVFLPGIALAAVAGLPFTVGAVGRWSFYASMLRAEEATLLIITMVADALLVAGLWSALKIVLIQTAARRLALFSVLSMVALVVPLILWGLAPARLPSGLGVETADTPDVSVWGLGFVFLLPWLVGFWLVHVRNRSEGVLNPVRQVIGLDWLYRAADWLGQRFVTAVHWVGLVGEGEGWWGWALVILALGTMFLTLR